MNTPPQITIELIGSFTARHVETGTTVDLTSRRNRNTTKSAIPPLCRLLIQNGADPEARVHVIRKALDREGMIPVFNRDRSLAKWAELDVVESDTQSLRVTPHRPYAGPQKQKAGKD